jgi:hypothetical protein
VWIIEVSTQGNRIYRRGWRIDQYIEDSRSGIAALIDEPWSGAMKDRIGSTIPRLVYATLTATVLTAGPARAADDCLAGPNADPPQGSHWYYRVDRAQQRHCWYLGPQGRQIRRSEPDSQPAVKSTALSAQESEPPLPLPRPGSLPAATPEPVIEATAERGREEAASFEVQSPDPDQSIGRELEAGGANLHEDVNAGADPASPIAATPVNVRPMILGLILLLIASAASAAIIIIHPVIFRIVAARRRRLLESSRRVRTASIPREKARPMTAPRPHGPARPRAEPIDLPGLEEGIREIVRAMERRAA